MDMAMAQTDQIASGILRHLIAFEALLANEGGVR